MAGYVGRKLKIIKNGTVIAGVRTKSFTWGGESINVTSGEDDGIRLLLAESGEEQIDISFEGVAKDTTFRDLVLGSGSKMLDDITLEFGISNPSNTTNATLSCDFKLSSYEEGAPYNDAVTFTGSLESSGAWTYTPEAA